jgi:hypothetical protein
MERFTRSAGSVNKTALKLTILVEIVGPLVESTASLGIAGRSVLLLVEGSAVRRIHGPLSGARRYLPGRQSP